MENKGFKRWFGYLIARIAARAYCIFIFKSSPKRISSGLDTPFVLVCNHQTDFDLALMVCSFKEMLVPVASEHVVTGKITGTLISRCLKPITVIKGSIKVTSVKQMIKALRADNNIMIHPEGSRTFDGQTMEIGDAIGKVVKTSRAALITYTVRGGYLKSPRWALKQRKGKVTGNVVNVYNAETLKSMSAAEITEAIRNDLYVNDYESSNGRYTVKNGAEGIENFLFMCPECGRIGTLKGKGNLAACDCGFSAKIDDRGLFGGQDMISLGKHQKEQFLEMYSETIEFHDANVVLERIYADHSREKLAEGTLTGSAEGISIGDLSFAFEDMEDEISMIGKGNTATFTVDKIHYDIMGEGANMYKYWLLYRMKLGLGIS